MIACTSPSGNSTQNTTPKTTIPTPKTEPPTSKTETIIPKSTTGLIAFKGANGKYGYKNQEGKAVIPADYEMAFTEDFSNKIAFVATGEGIMAIDQTGTPVLAPFVIDNGPDELQEGLFRFVEKEKFGFADKDGYKVIPAKFDFVGSFREALAPFCKGCTAKKDGEMTTWGGGKWGYLSKNGQVAIEAIYDQVTAFGGGVAKVQQGGKTVVINTRGEQQ